MKMYTMCMNGIVLFVLVLVWELSRISDPALIFLLCDLPYLRIVELICCRMPTKKWKPAVRSLPNLLSTKFGWSTIILAGALAERSLDSRWL